MNPHDNEKNKTQVAASINKYFPVTKEELKENFSFSSIVSASVWPWADGRKLPDRAQ